MDFAQYWFSDLAAGPAPDNSDPGDPIANSLRFRGTASIHSPAITDSSTGQEWCMSFWVKKGTPGASNASLFQDSAGYPNGWWYTDGRGYDYYTAVTANAGGAAYVQGAAIQRDYSAWYHIFLNRQTGSDTGECWINGVKYCDASAFWHAGSPIDWVGYLSTPSDFYLADYHFVSGNHRAVTDFGRYNANGVWVPVDPSLAIDTNFTQYLTTPGNSWNQTYSNPPSSAFDGGTSEYVSPLATNDPITFAPADAIPFGSSFRVYMCHYADSTYTLNGNAVDTSGMSVGACGWQTVATGPGTLENFTMKGSTSGTWLYAFELDGAILTDGVNPNYGADGWHLDFADPTDIGKDVSGNGNDFTATGFDTAPVGIFSDMLVDPPGGYESGRPPTAMFDGNTGTWAQILDNNDVLDFSPTTPIAYNTLEYYTYGATWTLTQEDDTVTTGGDQALGSQWDTITTTPGTIKQLTFANSVGTPAVAAIRINGNTILVDNTGVTYDLMQDSPTNNFATINPLVAFDNGTARNVTDANLANNGTGVQYPLHSSIAVTHKAYCEFTGPETERNIGLLGFNGIDVSDALGYVQYGPHSIGINPDGNVYVNSASVATVKTYTSTDILGLAFDPDTREVFFSINGVFENSGNPIYTFPNPLPAGMNWHMSATALSGKRHYNFGQQPFKHTPPAGFEPLSTANMPTPTIYDGRDHFQAITEASVSYSKDVTSSSGAWISGQEPYKMFDGNTGQAGVNANAFTQTLGAGDTLTWTPSNPIAFTDKVEVNMYGQVQQNTYNVTVDGVTTQVLITPNDNNEWHVLASGGGNFEGYDCTGYYGGSPKGNRGECGVLTDKSILEGAQSTFPNGLWWIHDRTVATNPQLVDSVNGTDNVYPQGTENSSGVGWNNRRAYLAPTGDCVAYCWDASNPTTSGFSITNGTHGLGAAPFMVVNREGWIYHESIADLGHPLATSAMSISTSNIFLNAENWIVNDTTITSDAGGPYYAWRHIPGYNAYGSYTGNGSADGPFFYCGFKPAFLMVTYANTTSGDLRRIYDSTRDTYNPLTHTMILSDNVAYTEQTESNGAIDFLSNGWKLRGTGYPNGGTPLQWVWTAFAENPFGGPVPVTAR